MLIEAAMKYFFDQTDFQAIVMFHPYAARMHMLSCKPNKFTILQTPNTSQVGVAANV